jgi:hypothetical protein
MGLLKKDQVMPAVVGGVITLVVLVCVNYINKVLQAHSQITYTVSNATPFTINGKTSAIYVAKAQSVSSEPATHVVMLVKIAGAITLQTTSDCSPNVDCKISAPPGDGVTVSADSLNKDESLQLTIQATGNGPLPAKPQVNVRFDGGLGHELSGRQSFSVVSDVVGPLGSSALVWFVFYIFFFKKRTKEIIQKQDVISQKQKEITAYLDEVGKQGLLDPQLTWAYVYDQCGLPDRASRALAVSPHLLSPWFEAEHLVKWALAEDSSDRIPRALKTLNGMTSLGIVGKETEASLDLCRAKLALALNDPSSAALLVQRARGHSPDEVTRRLQVDSDLERYRSNSLSNSGESTRSPSS